jgi:hypothetical protein
MRRADPPLVDRSTLAPNEAYPRYGIATHFHTTDNAGFQTYTPPTSGRGGDWILVLESEAAGFPLPGPR